MKAVLQRVSSGRVTIDGRKVGEIGRGLVVLLGVAQGDSDADVRWLAGKIEELRIFEDDAGKMNVSLVEIGGEVLLVSQFTLLANCRKGRRPSFTRAAPPELGEELYERFAELLRADGVRVATGEFGAMMVVSIENEGPVTIVLDSEERTRPRSGRARPRSG